LFGFPGFLKEFGKSKLKNSKIQTIMRENQNKKQFFYSLDFSDFMFGFRLLIVFLFGFPGYLFGLPGFLFGFPKLKIKNKKYLPFGFCEKNSNLKNHTSFNIITFLRENFNFGSAKI
jgi:hypothetical protein